MRSTWTSWSGSRGGLQKMTRGIEHLSYEERLRDWACRKEGFREDLQQSSST